MHTQIRLGEISVDVTFKDIKNVHLSVYPPEGSVRISAPERMNIDSVRLFAISKLAWIKQQQKKLRQQERTSPRDYTNGETHFVWGKRYLMRIIVADSPSTVTLSHGKIILTARRKLTEDQMKKLLARFYRNLIRESAPALINKWSEKLGVNVTSIVVRQMKTKWGSCTQYSGAIRLNTELAQKPKHLLEYIVIHEMVHLIDRTHGPKFVKMMDRHMPHWRHYRDELNSLPLAEQHWDC